MVSTRRGVRVSSDAQTDGEQGSGVSGPPSTVRRTRITVKRAESPSQDSRVETNDGAPPVSPPPSALKRCTQASRLHSPELPPTASPRDEDISEAESCSSAVSPPTAVRRSTRRTRAPVYLIDHVEDGEAAEDQMLEVESSSPVASKTKRVTRSQRKTARPRSAAKCPVDDSEVSDAESCASSVSASTARRTRRSAHPIPFILDQTSDHSGSPVLRGRSTRTKALARGPRSPNSDGFESGSTYSISQVRSRSRGAKAVDSDSDATDRGTPCSSRTGSGNSSRRARVTRGLSIVLEKDSELNFSAKDSRLESTLAADDMYCVPLEDSEDETPEEGADVTMIEAETSVEEVVEKIDLTLTDTAVSAPTAVRRSTRRTPAPVDLDSDHVEDGEAVEDQMLEVESSSPVASKTKRVTRSQRKTARPRSAAKCPVDDSEVSDAESCASSVSASTARRTRRSAHPIPVILDQTSDHSGSPVLRVRSTRTKALASGPRSPNSDGFESGSTDCISQVRSRSRGAKAVDSDATDRGTPCSSRTGSGNSSHSARVTRKSTRDLSIVLKKDSRLNFSAKDSRLVSTLAADDMYCVPLEDSEDETPEEGADVTTKEVETSVEEVVEEIDLTLTDTPAEEDTDNNRVIVIEDVSDGSNTEAKENEESTCKPAVTATDQQEEPSAENTDKDPTEEETMQEMTESSELKEPGKLAPVRESEEASGVMEEDKDQEEEEAPDGDAEPSQGDEAPDDDEEEKESGVETRPSEVEVTEVSSEDTETPQAVEQEAEPPQEQEAEPPQEQEAEPIEVTQPQQSVTVDSEPEQQTDVVVQKTKVISLLESSDEEEESEEDEKEVPEEEEEEEEEGGGGGGGGRPETSGAVSMGGLFMIDTRPGEEVDGQYFREEPAEEEEKMEADPEEQDEEFVDEDGEDDEDNEDAKVLFTCRNPQLHDFSTRIDPGIRMKELGGLYINFAGGSKPVTSSQKTQKKKAAVQDEVMKKSVMGPEFEKLDAVPPYKEAKQALKLKHRAEREKSTGEAWFDMKAPELTQELKGDLQVLKMRGSLDPKRFYKKNDRDGLPKYFQVGTVVDNPVDFYHSRLPTKARKRTMVEELLADAEFRHQNKKKYQQIMAERAARGAGKKNRKKNKFQKK